MTGKWSWITFGYWLSAGWVENQDTGSDSIFWHRLNLATVAVPSGNRLYRQSCLYSTMNMPN